MGVTIRRAEESDAARVGDLAARLARQHVEYDGRRFAALYDAEQAARFYAGLPQRTDTAVLVAEFDGEIAGFAYLQFEERDYPNLLERAAWLHDIFLTEPARRSGAGRRLIEESVAAARALGADKLMLSVAVENEFARGFFERRGFRPTMIEMMLDLGSD